MVMGGESCLAFGGIFIKNKRASEKYYIIISFILGLMILAIGLQLIFDIGGKDDIDFEACRNSIIIRSGLPEPEIVPGVDTDLLKYSFKDKYPLKCKTKVIDINKENLKDINKTIGDALAECWALFDNGDSNAFPSTVFGSTSFCVPCARIHLTEEAKEIILKENKEINIREILDDRMTPKYSYYSYLRDSGRQFPALDVGSSGKFDLEGDSFSVATAGSFGGDIGTFSNRLTKESTSLININSVFLPGKFNIDDGDLLINYGVNVASQQSVPYVPYLFYFQTEQEIDPFEEVNKNLVSGISFCESWEGIPA